MSFNGKKYREEWDKLYSHMKTTIKEDMKHPKRVFHNYIDLYVESARASPYIMGHIYAVLIPLLIFCGIL